MICPVCREPLAAGDRVARVAFGRFVVNPDRRLQDDGMLVRRTRTFHEICGEAAGVASEDVP